jgi:hypothetical protein
MHLRGRAASFPNFIQYRVMSRWPGLLAICLILAPDIFPQTTLTGTLRRITDDRVIIQTDKAAVTVVLGITTKYYQGSPSGAMIRSADFQPGDHIGITATQDAQGIYHAQTISRIKPGTPAERAAASKSTATDPDDSGPPQLRRGIPRPKPDSSPEPDLRPGLRAEESNGVTRIPTPPKDDPNVDVAPARLRPAFPTSGDPVIDKAREAAFTFAQTLPNFVVKQVTTRYDSQVTRNQTNWHAFDTITADVISEDGRESYRNILENGHPPTRPVDESGSWSTGEYSSVLLDVFSASTRAAFHDQRATTIVDRPAWRYDYQVDARNSHWMVTSRTTTISPEYAGSIWIDKETFRTLRLELAGRNMPKDFELDTVECAIDYDFVTIGANRFLLPLHSEILSCERRTGSCARNVIDFRDYRKFTADSSIKFDQDADK